MRVPAVVVGVGLLVGGGSSRRAGGDPNSNPNPTPKPNPADGALGTLNFATEPDPPAEQTGQAAAGGRLKSASQPAQPVDPGTPTEAQAPQGGKHGPQPRPDPAPQAETSRKRMATPQKQRNKKIAKLEDQIEAARELNRRLKAQKTE